MMSMSVEVVSLEMTDHHRPAHLGTIGHPVEYPRAIVVWLRETCRRAIQVVLQGRYPIPESPTAPGLGLSW